MPTSRIEIIVDGKDNASGALRSIGGSMDQLGGHAGKMGGALGRMGEIAGGILGAQAIMGVGRALGGAVKEAFEATASYEKLGMALENLAKKDFIRAGTATKLIQVGTQEVGQTTKNAAAISDLTLKRDLLMAKMQEQAERHRQLIAKWGEEGLAVKTHAAQMAVDQQAIDKVNAKMAELGASGSKVIGVYKKVTEQFISDAEAKEMAAKTSKELLGWIEQLAIKSPFTQDGIQSAFKTAMAYGFITDQAADLMVKTGQLDEKQRANTVTAQRLTQAMIDYASGAGLSPEIMDRVSLALGQIQARGKLAGQEVMQLTEAGISVDAILAQAFGKTTNEIVAMREKGLIPADQAILAITQSLERDFGGAAAAQTQTFAGLVSSLSDIKTIGLREFFTGTFEALQPYLAGFTDWASTLGPKLAEIGATLGGAVAGALQTISGLIQSFQTGGVGGVLGALGLPPEAAALLEGVAASVGTVATNLQTFAGAAGALFTALSGGVPQLAGLQAGLTAIDAGLPGLMGNMVFLGSTIDGVVQQVVGSFNEDWGPAWRLAQTTVEQTIDGVRSIVVNVLTLITGSIADHATQLKALFFEAYSRIQQTVGQVLAAVSLIVTSILGNIKTFIATHGDDIRTFLGNAWEQIGRIINLATQLIQATIVPIFQGIARFIQEHGDEIQQALSITWNAIKGIISFVLDLIEGIIKVALKVLKGDWSGAWEEIKKTGEKLWGDIQQVIGANLDALKLIFGKTIDNIKTKVKSWMDDTKKKIDDGLQEASDAVQTKLDDIKQWFTDKFNDILTWLGELPGKLKQVGIDMIQGMIDGVGEMGEALWDAVTGLIDEAIQKIKDLLNMHSPSLVFVQIAVNMIKGLILGIQQMTPDAVQAMAAALGAVLDSVVKALDAFARLAELPVIDDLGARLNRLTSYIRTLVAAFAVLAGYYAGPGTGLDGAAAVLDPLGEIFSKLGAVIQGIAALGTLEMPVDLVVRIVAFVAMLRSIMPLLTTALVQIAAEFTPAALLAAAAFAETAGIVVAPLAAMVDAFTAVATWVPAHLEPAFAGLLSQLRRLARLWVIGASGFDAEMLEGALWFASVAGALVAPLSAMVDGFAAVATWVPAYLEPLFAGMLSQLRRLAKLWKTAVSGFDEDMLEGALWFASIAGALVAPLQAMVQGFQAAATWVPEWLEPLFAGMLSQLRRLARLWKTAVSGFDAEMLEGALWFAGVASTLAAPLKTMVDGFAAVATWVPKNLEPLFAGLLSQLRRLARLWITAANGFDADLLAGALVFADAASKLVAPLKAMVDAFTAVAGYGGFQDIVLPFDALVSQLRQLVPLMIAAASLFDAKAVEAATSFAEMAGKIVSPLKAMADAFTAVAGYAGFQDIVLPFDALVTQLRQLVPLMITAAGLFDAKAVEAATSFAEMAGKIVSPLKAMADAFTAVTGYAGFQDIVLPFDALVTQLRQLVPLMITAASLFDDEAVQAAAVFAGRVQSLVGFIQPSVAALKALADYQAAQNINRAIQAFITDIVVVADALREGLGNATPEMLAALDVARQFSDRVQGIVGFIRPAMDAMKELRDYARPYGVGTGIVTLLRDLETLITWLNTFAGSIGANTITTAAAFAETLERIVASIEAALAGLSRLASAYSAGELVGGSWMDGIIAGLNSRLTDLETLMAYIRGLFPSSPAKHGPFRSLPDGEKFGSQWGGGLVAGLGGAIMPLTSMLAGLQSSMLSPSMVGGGSSYALSQTVNLNGTFNVREEQDIQSIAEAVGGILSQQASVNRRMNVGWAAAM